MGVRPYRIELSKAREAIESGKALVLDLTSPFINRAVRGRIPGAVRVSARAILDPNRRGADLLKDLPELSPDQPIIAYCTCPDEEASLRLTRALRHEGYQAWMLDGGLPAWRAAGYPMEANLAA